MNAEIIRFLDDLRRNNNTVWFHENRERYDKLRCAFINEVQELIERISVFDPDIRGLDARKCLFRINRDIRFSLDKSPYKTYMSACEIAWMKSSTQKPHSCKPRTAKPACIVRLRIFAGNSIFTDFPYIHPQFHSGSG